MYFRIFIKTRIDKKEDKCQEIQGPATSDKFLGIQQYIENDVLLFLGWKTSCYKILVKTIGYLRKNHETFECTTLTHLQSKPWHLHLWEETTATKALQQFQSSIRHISHFNITIKLIQFYSNFLWKTEMFFGGFEISQY